MTGSPNILLLEDNDEDAHLIVSVLAETGEVQWVTTKEQFVKHLETRPCDVVIADHAIPPWDGMEAIRFVRESYPRLPCVLISGVKDERFAAEAIRGGASDFVSKDNLDRLPLVVVRVVSTALTEDQLIRAQRLDAVGAVLSGMMHDLNGLMTLLPGSIGLVRQKLGVPGQVENCRKWLDIAENTTKRVMDMMGRMRVFLHGDEVPYGRLNISQLLRELANSVSVFLPKEITVQLTVPANDLEIQGNSSEIYQVLLNLLSNARDAMPKGGKITIRAHLVRLADFPMLNSERVTGEFVQVSVSDTGFGMTKEVRRRIFEPLFTTKERGSGIGLSTSLRVIRAHHGHVDLLSEVGKGTTFHLYFPRVNGHDTSFVTTDGVGRLLLVVDDEKSVLEAFKAVLESNNYRVITALCAAEAFALYKANSEEIYCVLTDVAMPDGNGFQLIQELRELKPDLRIVIVTGSANVSQTAADAVLLKPVTPAMLFDALA